MAEAHGAAGWVITTIRGIQLTYENILGGNSGGVTPVPISNTEVKPAYVDGTALERVWESRKSPG